MHETSGLYEAVDTFALSFSGKQEGFEVGLVFDVVTVNINKFNKVLFEGHSVFDECSDGYIDKW